LWGEFAIMPTGNESAETILIVDDEEAVRKTFREWLEGANLGCRILTAADAESALMQANQQTVDLAILDWNLGAGNDGLRLLEDLTLFNADVVAIMITGFAHQATPLDAMRMGVRDYLDKNQDLDRETFLTAVRRQLDRIRPAKRERRLHQSLVAFREAVEKVVPLVQSAAILNDPVPLPEAIGSLFRFLLRTTGARDGVKVHSGVHDLTVGGGVTCSSREGKVHQIPTFLQSSAEAGMISFDQHLAQRLTNAQARRLPYRAPPADPPPQQGGGREQPAVLFSRRCCLRKSRRWVVPTPTW